jgi:hypothetical protein
MSEWNLTDLFTPKKKLALETNSRASHVLPVLALRYCLLNTDLLNTDHCSTPLPLPAA